MTTALFKVWKTNRNIYLSFLENYSKEQLNLIPTGFNNNLIWNIAHVVVAQQSLIYRGAGLPMSISMEMVEKYMPGTKPTGHTSEEEIAEIKNLLIAPLEQTEKDYQQGLFKTYKERQTSTGFHLGNIEDALNFNNYHEGLHLGYMMSLRKFV